MRATVIWVARFRKLDALRVIVLAGIVLSLAAMGLGGSPRMLPVRENIFSIPIGLVAQGALLGWMAWTWPISTCLLVSKVIGYGAVGAISLWNWRYAKTRRQGAPAVIAAEK